MQPAALAQTQATCRWHHLEGLTSDAGIRVLQDLQINGEEVNLRRFVKIADGHPLLLLLGASWLAKRQPVPNVSDILSERDLNLFKDLAGSHRGDPETRVGNLLTASVKQLGTQPKSLWLDLSVYNFPFGSKAVKAMMTQLPENITEQFLEEGLSKVEERNLEDLVHSSLLKQESKSDQNEWQYRFLRLIKDFARNLAGNQHNAKQKAIEYCRLVAKPSGWSPSEAQTAVYYRTFLKPPEWKTQGDIVEYLEIFHHYRDLNQYALAFYFLWHTGCDAFLELRGYNSLRTELFEALRDAWNPIDAEQPTFARMLDCLGTAYRSLGQYTLAIALHNSALNRFRAVGNHEIEEATSLRNLGEVYRRQGNNQKAEDFFEQAQKISHRLNDGLGELLALEELINIGNAPEKYEKNIKHYQSLIQFHKRWENPSSEADSWHKLGTTYKKLGMYPEAIKALGKARQIFRRIGNDSEVRVLRDLGDAYESLSASSHTSNRWSRSKRARQAATRAYCQVLQASVDESERATTLCSIGWILSSSGEHQAAIDQYEQALEIFQATDNPSGKANVLNGLGHVHSNLGQCQQAQENYQEALTIHRELGDRAGEAVILNNLGVLYENQGKFSGLQANLLEQSNDNNPPAQQNFQSLELLRNLRSSARTQYTEAVSSYQQSLEIKCNLHERDLPGETRTQHNLGRAYNLLGQDYYNQRQYQNAAQLYQQALDAFEGITGAFRSSVTEAGEATALLGLANAYHFLGQYLDAVGLHQRTLEIRQRLGDRPGEADALLGLGDAYYALGNYASSDNPNAISFYQQALSIFQEIEYPIGVAKVQLGLSKTYHALGHCQRAVQLLNDGVI